jgi:serine/threonine protein kinase
MLNGSLPSYLFPKEPPAGLTLHEFHWFIEKTMDKGIYASINDIVEVLMSYDLINESSAQGIVLRDWIKQEYEKEKDLKPKRAQDPILNLYDKATELQPLLDNNKQHSKKKRPTI